MIVRQLSVFLENKKGRLLAVMEVLAEHGVNVSVLSLADTSEYGILRLIVNDPDRAKEVLTESGVVVRITPVIALSMDDAPGGTAGVLRCLSAASISVEYMYACVGGGGKALMVIRPDDPEAAETLLRENGYDVTVPDEVYRI